MTKNQKVAACITVGLLAVMTGCGGNDTQPTPAGGGAKGMLPAVSVSVVKLSSIVASLQLTGSVEPVRVARLASPVEGPVQTLWAREGDMVKAGKRLVDIGRKGAASAQLVAAREYLQKQEQELQRVTKLVADGAIAESELDAARSQYENARAQYVRAGEAAGDFRISAPWSGVIAEVLVTEGDFVAPRTPLLEMYDPSTLVISASVPETRATELRRRAPVKISFDAYPRRTFTGFVSRIYPRLDAKTRTRTFEITVHDTVTLIPGMFARLDVEAARADSAVVVAENAVVTTSKGEMVVYVIEKNTAVSRPVTIGIHHKGRIQITKGLAAGETVVVAGNEKLKNGARVRIANGKDTGTGKKSGMGDKAQSPGSKRSAKEGAGK
jgi:RND family efflux transporter MFP subunit